MRRRRSTKVRIPSLEERPREMAREHYVGRVRFLLARARSRLKTARTGGEVGEVPQSGAPITSANLMAIAREALELFDKGPESIRALAPGSLLLVLMSAQYRGWHDSIGPGQDHVPYELLDLGDRKLRWGSWYLVWPLIILAEALNGAMLGPSLCREIEEELDSLTSMQYLTRIASPDPEKARIIRCGYAQRRFVPLFLEAVHDSWAYAQVCRGNVRHRDLVPLVQLSDRQLPQEPSVPARMFRAIRTEWFGDDAVCSDTPLEEFDFARPKTVLDSKRYPVQRVGGLS